MIQKSFETMTPQSAASTDLDSLITRYCNHLGLSVPLQRACAATGTRVVDEGVLAGRSPITIASSCILFVTTLFGARVDPKKIAEVAGVQDSTIRTGYRSVSSRTVRAPVRAGCFSATDTVISHAST